MGIKNALLGGTDEVDGEAKLAVDYNDTNDTIINSVNQSDLSIKQITDSDSTGTLQVKLSDQIWVNYDSGTSKIQQTINAGSAWTDRVTGLANSINSYYVNPNDPNYMIFYGRVAGNEIEYTTNGGTTFTSVTEPSDAGGAYNIAYSITDTGRIYVVYSTAAPAGEIKYSDDGGSNWTDVSGHQGFVPNQESFIATPKNDIIAYAVDQNGTDLYGGYTLDGGSNWVEHNTGDLIGHVYIYNCLYIDSSNYLIDIGLDGASEQGISIVVWNGTTISSDANDSWSIPDSSNEKFLYKFDLTWGFAYSNKNSLIMKTYLYLPSSDYVNMIQSNFGEYMYHGEGLDTSQNRVLDQYVYEMDDQPILYNTKFTNP